MASGVSAARCPCSFCVVPVMRRQCLRPRNRRLSHSDATSPIGSNRRGCVFYYFFLFYFTSSVFVDYVFTDKGGPRRVVKRVAMLPSRACVLCVRVAITFFFFQARVVCLHVFVYVSLLPPPPLTKLDLELLHKRLAADEDFV